MIRIILLLLFVSCTASSFAQSVQFNVHKQRPVSLDEDTLYLDSETPRKLIIHNIPYGWYVTAVCTYGDIYIHDSILTIEPSIVCYLEDMPPLDKKYLSDITRQPDGKYYRADLKLFVHDATRAQKAILMYPCFIRPGKYTSRAPFPFSASSMAPGAPGIVKLEDIRKARVKIK